MLVGGRRRDAGQPHLVQRALGACAERLAAELRGRRREVRVRVDHGQAALPATHPTPPPPAATDSADGLWALRAACRGGFDAVVVDSCNVPKVWITPTALPRSTISIFLEPGIDEAGAASFAEEEGWDGVVSSPEEAVQFLTGRTVVAEEGQPDAELDLDALHPAVARFVPFPLPSHHLSSSIRQTVVAHRHRFAQEPAGRPGQRGAEHG